MAIYDELNHRLWVANVGDSRGVLGSFGTNAVVPLSYDHKPNNVSLLFCAINIIKVRYTTYLISPIFSHWANRGFKISRIQNLASEFADMYLDGSMLAHESTFRKKDFGPSTDSNPPQTILADFVQSISKIKLV